MHNKYELIAEDLRQKIFAHDYEIGSQLPQEIALSKAYGASRITIRRALDELLNEGLIYKIQGSGTFVREDKPVNSKMVGKFELFDMTYIKVDVQNFSVVSAPAELRAKLMITEFDLVYEIERTFSSEKGVFAFERGWLPIKYIQGMNLSILKGSIFEFMNDDLDIEPDHAERKVVAKSATEDLAEILEIDKGLPLINIVQETYMSNNRLFYLSEVDVNTKVYPLKQNL